MANFDHQITLDNSFAKVHSQIMQSQDEKQAIELLRRAAEKLQDYCAETAGDLNDGLAREIDAFIAKVDLPDIA